MKLDCCSSASWNDSKSDIHFRAKVGLTMSAYKFKFLIAYVGSRAAQQEKYENIFLRNNLVKNDDERQLGPIENAARVKHVGHEGNGIGRTSGVHHVDDHSGIGRSLIEGDI